MSDTLCVPQQRIIATGYIKIETYICPSNYNTYPKLISCNRV